MNQVADASRAAHADSSQPDEGGAAAPTSPTVDRPPRSRRARRSFSVVMVLLTIAAVVTGIVISLNRSTQARQAATSSAPTLLQVVSQWNPAVVAAAGSGAHLEALKALPSTTAALLDSHHIPIVLFVGNQTCGACAAERWSLVIALARFGRFDSLRLSTTPPTAALPAIPTFSFFGAVLASPYVSFSGVEQTDTAGKPLQVLTVTGRALLSTYDVPPYVKVAGGIPWLDIAGRWVMQDNSFPPAILTGLSYEQIAGRLAKPGDAVATALVGQANLVTAAICKVTSMRPAAVCTSTPIASLVAQLP